MRSRLAEIASAPILTPEDAARSAEAAGLLGDLLRWVNRAERVVGRPPGKSARNVASGGPLAGLTLHEAAKRVLSEAGVELHAKELAARIRAGGWNHPRAVPARSDQIVYQIAARLPKYPEIFERVRPNTFSLVEWQDSRAPALEEK